MGPHEKEADLNGTQCYTNCSSVYLNGFSVILGCVKFPTHLDAWVCGWILAVTGLFYAHRLGVPDINLHCSTTGLSIFSNS